MTAVVKAEKGKVKTTNSGSDSRPSTGVRLDPKNPTPLELENIPLYSITGDKYIPFLDKKDNYFNTILRARLGSTVHNACIVTKTNYTCGDGIVTNEKAAQDQLWKDFMACCNNKRQSLNRLYRSIIENFYTFGNVIIELVRGTAGGKKFFRAYVRNTLDCRLAWPGDNNEVNEVVISRLFRKKGTIVLNGDNCVRLPLYKVGAGIKDKYWIKDEKNKCERTAIWIKNDIAGYDHYGLPSFIASITSQLIEYQGARFNLDLLENNMVLSGMLALTGNISQPEAQRIADDVIGDHVGEGKNGRIGVVASEEGITTVDYKAFDTHKEGSYIEMDDKSTEKILVANEWDSALAGLQSGKALGKGGGYMKEIYNQKQKTVIAPVHRLIADCFFAPMVEMADEWMGTKWKDYEIDIKVSNLFEDTTEATNTVKGMEAFFSIIELVASGAWPLAAAIKFVSVRFGMTEKEATEQLGNIVVTPGITRTKTKTEDVQP